MQVTIIIIIIIIGYIPENNEWFDEFANKLKLQNTTSRLNEKIPELNDQVNCLTDKILSKKQRIREIEELTKLSIKQRIHLKNLKNSLIRAEKKLSQSSR